MRITTSENYFHDDDCVLGAWNQDDCGRHYCSTHRLLWRFCDTAIRSWEGDRDVIGGTRTVYDFGDCPACEREYSQKKFEREMEIHNARKGEAA